MSVRQFNEANYQIFIALPIPAFKKACGATCIEQLECCSICSFHEAQRLRGTSAFACPFRTGVAENLI
jgi:hypothetical protein